MKNNQLGRSMIEMLGVLAIIGVLSVGGIAGYSKAMQMYAINKHRDALIEFLSNFLRIKDELPYKEDGTAINYPEIMEAMDMLPKEFTVVRGIQWVNMRDKYGHNIRFYYSNNGFGILYSFHNNKNSSLVCQALAETALSFKNEVYMMYRQPMAGSGIPYYTIYGNNYCRKNYKCLNSLTVNDINELCYFYNDKDENKYHYVIQIGFKK